MQRQAGTREVLIHKLPGFPDGITRTKDGKGFWISLVMPKIILLKALPFKCASLTPNQLLSCKLQYCTVSNVVSTGMNITPSNGGELHATECSLEIVKKSHERSLIGQHASGGVAS